MVKVNCRGNRTRWLRSERLIYVDTSDCDEEGKGTPVFGTQIIRISGNLL